jgi:hypothetical protein
MGCHSGLEVVNTDLAFYYDMGNTDKSWKGAPTTNLLPQPLFFETGYTKESWSTGEVVDNDQIAPDNSKTATRITRVEGYFYKRNVTSPTFTISPGQTVTFSCWVKKLDSTNQTGRGIYIWCYNGAGSGNRASATQEIFNDRWVRQSVTYTALTGETDFSYGFSGGLATHLQGSIAIWRPHIEINSFASPFVNGTRSNTQVLLDLTNINTITANNLTYANNNTFSFNGTSNFMRPSVSHSYLSSSCLEVVFRKNAVTGQKFLFGYRHNAGYSLPTIGSMYFINNILYGSLITAAQGYRPVTSSQTIVANQYYHICLNKDTVNGSLQIYVNGVLRGSQTFDAATYAQWPSAGQFIGANILDIGKSTNDVAGDQGWGADFFDGDMPVCKVYGRILTSQEIQQNFNALRGRYGI